MEVGEGVVEGVGYVWEIEVGEGERELGIEVGGCVGIFWFWKVRSW